MLNLTDIIFTKKILVIGDVMLDMYLDGVVNRISPEAPVPVFRKSGERYVTGGAANVASNLVAANQNVSIMSIVGNDESGRKLIDLLEQQQISTKLVLTVDRRTTVKTRFIASNNQQVMRLDVEDAQEIDERECRLLLDTLKEEITQFDMIVLSDYLKGLFTAEFTQGVIQLAEYHQKKVIIDVKDPDPDKYSGCYLLKPNLLELQSLTGMNVGTVEEIVEASRYLLRRCSSTYVLSTCGARGMILVSEEEVFSVNAVCKEVFDVTGAGDTTIAYLAACLANGVNIKTAVEISNYAAGIQVAKLGTSSVYVQEVNEFLKRGKHESDHKLITDVHNFRSIYRDKKVVFTNGCFDILHVGHVRYLQEAAALGDMLIVGVNSDASVKRLKGNERPINPEQDRVEVLCGLGCVDYVIVFEEDTPYELIKTIQPDILVKGGDYKPEEVVGRDIVEARGGELRLIPFVEGKSTTGIINYIKQ